MSIFYKANDNKQHITDWRYKTQNDEWNYVKNIYHKADDNNWYPVWAYNWIPNAWGICTGKCRKGTQTRTITCVRNDGVARNDVFCTGITKPKLTQNCVPTTPSTKGIRFACRSDDGSNIYMSNKDGTNCGRLLNINGAHSYAGRYFAPTPAYFTAYPNEGENFIYLLTIAYNSGGGDCGIAIHPIDGPISNRYPTVISYQNRWGFGRVNYRWYPDPYWIYFIGTYAGQNGTKTLMYWELDQL